MINIKVETSQEQADKLWVDITGDLDFTTSSRLISVCLTDDEAFDLAFKIQSYLQDKDIVAKEKEGKSGE